MDARTRLGVAVPDIALSVAWNSACTHFAVGLNSGFKVFKSDGSVVLQPRGVMGRGVGDVQMFRKSNIFALTGGGKHPLLSSNKVVLWDAEKDRAAKEFSCLSEVRGVRLLRKRVFLMLKHEARVYSLEKGFEFLLSYPTAPNEHGLCSISEDRIAFPGRMAGHVQLVGVDGEGLKIMPAHSSAIRALSFSRDGELLATASEQGTLIRIWSASTNAKLAELRRGWDPSDIYSLGFNSPCTMLACTSDKGTLHIFDVPPQARQSGSAAETRPRSTHDFDANSLVDVGADHDHRGGGEKGKWGLLGKIGILPQYFRDEVSFASTQFWMGNEPGNASTGKNETEENTAFVKGVVGWTSDDSCTVLSAGIDPRMETFHIEIGQDGKRSCVRSSWGKYLA